MFPKLVAFETSEVLFEGSLREDLWGKGPGAAKKLADNIEHVDTWLLKDRSNNQNTVSLYADIPRIINDVLKNGATIAIVSRTDDKALCDRALYYFQATDPHTNKERSILQMVKYDEVVNEPKIKHFERIHNWSQFKYKDMIYFDSNPEGAVLKQGVMVRVPEPDGLTWEQYTRGVEVWRVDRKDYVLSLNPNLVPGDQTNYSTKELKIAHFNDVYQVSNQKLKINGEDHNIDVTKFATLLANVKRSWKSSGYDPADGLTIFSGDTFSPSFQSSITRGWHMTSIMNALNVDVSVAGNHEFDFGYRRLSELIEATNFPWLLSNIIDTDTGAVPVPLKSFHVLEKAGIRIGFIGLVEKEWIATITGWPENFEWQDMIEVGKKLSKILRDPAGPYKCDLVFALTHCRIPNDLKLAQELYALSPKAQTKTDITSQHGVDLLLGGHDHIYWISKGLGSWDGYDVNLELQDAATDKSDTLIVKSGSDFQDLSEVTLTLKPTRSGAVRKLVIESIKGIRHVTTGDLAVDENMKRVIDNELADINKAMADPICISEKELDARSKVVRTGESGVGNWVADCLKPTYNDVLAKLGHPPVDGVIICMGDIRGDSTYSKGPITLGDLMQMLPFTDPMVVVEMTGAALWTAMESGLSVWPVQEGRFPAISGFRVEWKTTNEPGNRIQEIWFQEESNELGPDGQPKRVDKEQVKRDSDRKYIISVGEYMAQGGDGYDILKEQKMLITGENGQSKSTLIRKFLLGAHFVNKVTHDPEAQPTDLQPETFDFISKARKSIHLPTLLKSTKKKVSELLKRSDSNPKTPETPDTPDSPDTPTSSDNHKRHSSHHSFSSISSTFSGFSSPLPTKSTFGIRDGAKKLARHVSDAKDSGRRAAHELKHHVSQHLSDPSLESVLDLAESIQEMVVSKCEWIGSSSLFRFAQKVAEHEDMSLVDSYDRRRLAIQLSRSVSFRSIKNEETEQQHETQEEVTVEKDLPVIAGAIDHRLKDLDGKASKLVTV